MENDESRGFANFLNRAMANPLFGIGLGMLSAPRGATVGQALGRGVGTANDLADRRQRNEALRAEMVARRDAREEQAARRAAWEQLLGELGVGAGVPATARTPGIVAGADPFGQPADLLAGFPGLAGRRSTAVPMPIGLPAGGGPGGGSAGGGGPPGAAILQLLARAQPEQAAAQMFQQFFRGAPQPTTFQRDFEFLTRGQGLPPEEALDRLRKGTVVNVGEGEKPLSASDLLKFRLPDGSVPPPGATTAQVAALGGVLMTDAQQKGLDAAQKYGPVMDRIETLALGEGGIFAGIEPGLGNRVQAGFDLFIGSLTGDNPNVGLYDDLVGSTLAPLIKQFGESGALAEGDVARAEGLLPRIRDEFLLPNTRAQAIEKLNTLREILDLGARNIQRRVFPGLKGGGRARSAAGADSGGGINNLPGTAEELSKMSDQEVLRALGY